MTAMSATVGRVASLMDQFAAAIGSDARIRAVASEVSAAAGFSDHSQTFHQPTIADAPWQMLQTVAAHEKDSNPMLTMKVAAFVFFWTDEAGPKIGYADYVELRLAQVPPPVQRVVAETAFSASMTLPADLVIIAGPAVQLTVANLGAWSIAILKRLGVVPETHPAPAQAIDPAEIGRLIESEVERLKKAALPTVRRVDEVAQSMRALEPMLAQASAANSYFAQYVARVKILSALTFSGMLDQQVEQLLLWFTAINADPRLGTDLGTPENNAPRTDARVIVDAASEFLAKREGRKHRRAADVRSLLDAHVRRPNVLAILREANIANYRRLK